MDTNADNYQLPITKGIEGMFVNTNTQIIGVMTHHHGILVYDLKDYTLKFNFPKLNFFI